MNYNMDLSSMYLEDLELFPECLLSTGPEKNEQPGITANNELHLGEPDFGCIPRLEDGQFPDWLDLKMDLSFLEGLETPDNVLDDLLLLEVNNGQPRDTLQTLQAEDKFPAPLDLDQHPFEQPSLNAEHDCTTSSAPSSPECRVPEMFTPESPISTGSLVSRPGSPDCILTPSIPSPYAPASADTTFLAFVTPVVQPISSIGSEVGVQSLPLDILSLSFVPADQSNSVQIQLQSDIPLPPTLDVSEKPKRERKRRATASLKKCPSKLKILTLQLEEESEACTSAPTSKKERKRQQNKDAAMRYRLKKRMETDTVSVEEDKLLEQNKKLKEKVQHLATELGYLKKLMREMFKAKGLLS